MPLSQDLKLELYVDKSDDSVYSQAMKVASTIVLIVLACTVLVPGSPALFLAGQDHKAAIGNIDVCSSGVPAVTSGGEMPCVNESSHVQAPFCLSVLAELQNMPLMHSLLSTQTEHPPKV